MEEQGLTTAGWIFMIVSISGVWLLAIVCYKKLLFDADENDND